MLKILVVDDESPIREWITFCIEKSECEFQLVGTAKNGAEALEMIQDQHPDVVITDIKMPEMDGLELMTRVKDILPNTDFIILTSYAEFNYAKQAISIGAIEYLIKSELRSTELLQILQKIQLEHRQRASRQEKGSPNDDIDLHDLFEAHDEISFVQSFCIGIGMDPALPYCILSMKEYDSSKQRQSLIDTAKEISPAFYCLAVWQMNRYIILQEKNKSILGFHAADFAIRVYRQSKQPIAVGPICDRLDNFGSAVEMTLTTLSSEFFYPESNVILYEKLNSLNVLKRSAIRSGYRDILSLVSAKQNVEAVAAIKDWFGQFDQVGIQDIHWAREVCIKMVFSLEERFYHYFSSLSDSGVESWQMNSVQACREKCISLLENMHDEGTGAKSQSINAALEYIHKNYNQDISLITVANQVFRSPEYFSRLFKEEMGVNFSVYLMMYRLNCADQLMRMSDRKISQIAADVGYKNSGYFSKIYKKYMGRTPEEAKYQYMTHKSN